MKNDPNHPSPAPAAIPAGHEPMATWVFRCSRKRTQLTTDSLGPPSGIH